VIDALGSVMLNAGFLLVGVLGWRMFRGSPPRLPKLATILMGVGGVAVATPIAWALGFVQGILPSTVAGFFTLALAVVTVVVAWDVINELLPKMGKVAGGSATYATGLKAAAIPGLAVATGIVAASWYASAFSTVGSTLADIAAQVT